MGHKVWKLLEISYGYPRESGDKMGDSHVFMALERLTLTQDFGEIVGLIGGKELGRVR